MRRFRVVPVLLLHNRGLVKSVRFKDYRYIGDPVNAVKIFNEKEVDEIVVLDISATKQGRGPDLLQVAAIAGEAFMPLSYGGGVRSLEHAEKLFCAGVEKLVLNYATTHNRRLLKELVSRYGCQAIAVSIDYRINWLGRASVFHLNGTESIKMDPVTKAKEMQDLGVGEILLNAIERDGTYKGYDLPMLEKVTNSVSIPVVACGGARDISDFRKAMEAGASAVAAGSMFVLKRPHNAVLISYPTQEALRKEFLCS